MHLELDEGIFGRLEVGTAGRQIVEFGSAGFNCLPDAPDFMAVRLSIMMVSPGRSIAGPTSAPPKPRIIHCSSCCREASANEPRKRVAADIGGGLPITMRDCGAATLAFRGVGSHEAAPSLSKGRSHQ